MFTRYRLIFLLLLSSLLLLTGCEINRLKSAEDLYQKHLYATAIQELDDLIANAENRAIATKAEILRSNSYIALAEAAVEKKNWPLAIRFFKLSNSDAANFRLAEIYRDLAVEASKAGNLELSKIFLDTIYREVPETPIIPEVLYRRIAYYVDVKADNEAAWADYMQLYDNYPNNPYEVLARNYVIRFIPGKLDYAAILNEQGYYTDALKELFEISKYPVVDMDRLNKQISDVYERQAEELINEQDYVEADRLFRIALQYYPQKKDSITNRLESITNLFIQKGNSLLEAGDYEAALIHYRKTFDIIPDYPPAVEAIKRVYTIQENIRKAGELFSQAERLEATGKLNEALQTYNAAYALDPKPEYKQKAAIVQNIMEANKNPSAFARRILNEYRGGILNTRIQNQKKELLKRYKENEIQDSGWKLMLSTGQYKYEARYDLLTPNETYLYVWQINLRDRSIVPLNKLSEALMQ